MGRGGTRLGFGAWLAGGMLAALALALPPGGASAETIFNVKIGYATVNDPQHQMGVAIGRELQKRSNGRLTYSIFPAAQLGKIPRQIEGIQLGAQEFFLTPPAFLTGLNPAFQASEAPGMYDSIAHGHRALTHPIFRDQFLALAENKGILGTQIYLYDGISYASRTPIRTPEDLYGMKIRSLPTPMERAVLEEFGAEFKWIPYSEIVPAFMWKKIDGARSSLIVMAASKFFTVFKNITVLNDRGIPSVAWVSKRWANKLPADLRKIVLEMPRELEDWGAQNAIARYKVSEQAWRDNGAEVIRFSDADHKSYMDAIREIGETYLGEHDNPEVREMYGLFKKAVAATR